MYENAGNVAYSLPSLRNVAVVSCESTRPVGSLLASPMTTPIKPPGAGDSAAADPAALDPGGSVDPTEGTEQAERPEEAEVINEPLDQIASDLKAGRIDMDTAMDQLVEQATQGAAQALTETGRAELRAFLRSALESDPALSQLVRELKD